MIVIDASSLSKLLLKEERWEEVGKHLKDDLYSPSLVALESANAIRKHHLSKKINEARAIDSFGLLKKTISDVITIEQSDLYIDDGFKIAIENKVSVYDALYIAEAKRLGSLLTSDRRQRDAAEGMGVKTIYIG